MYNVGDEIRSRDLTMRWGSAKFGERHLSLNYVVEDSNC